MLNTQLSVSEYNFKNKNIKKDYSFEEHTAFF